MSLEAPKQIGGLLILGLDAGHQLLPLGDLAGYQLRVFAVAESRDDFNRAQEVAIDNPNVPPVSLAAHFGLLVRRPLRVASVVGFPRCRSRTIENLTILRPNLVAQRVKP